MKARIAYRFGNDGVTGDAPVAPYAGGTGEVNNDGTFYGATFAQVNGDGKQLIQWGIECANNAGSLLEMAVASFKIDRRAN